MWCFKKGSGTNSKIAQRVLRTISFLTPFLKPFTAEIGFERFP